MKIILLIAILCLLTACTGRVIYKPDPGCAARTLKAEGFGDHPGAKFTLIGSTWCAADSADPNAIVCPDPFNKWCK